jgi:hypothetical protein
MKIFKVTFLGRLKNALGVRYWITTEVEAVDKEGILVALYDKYEQVCWLKDIDELV